MEINIDLINLVLKILTIAVIPPLVWMFSQILQLRAISSENQNNVKENIRRLNNKAVMIAKDEEKLTELEVEMEKMRTNYIKQFGDMKLDLRMAIKDNEENLSNKIDKLADTFDKKCAITRKQTD